MATPTPGPQPPEPPFERVPKPGSKLAKRLEGVLYDLRQADLIQPGCVVHLPVEYADGTYRILAYLEVPPPPAQPPLVDAVDVLPGMIVTVKVYGNRGSHIVAVTRPFQPPSAAPERQREKWAERGWTRFPPGYVVGNRLNSDGSPKVDHGKLVESWYPAWANTAVALVGEVTESEPEPIRTESSPDAPVVEI